MLKARFEDIDEDELADLVALVQELAHDYTFRCKRKRKGSVILTFEGSEEGVERLTNLFELGLLNSLLGYEVQDVIPEDEHSLSGTTSRFPVLPRFPSDPQYNYSDKDLVALLQQGNLHAGDILYYRHIGLITSFVRRRLAPSIDYEQVSNDVFVKALRNIHKFSNKSNFRKWLEQIAINTILALTISRRQETPHEPLSETIAVLDEMDSSLQRIALRQAINRLPSHQREVILLRYFEQLTFNEIADRLGISPTSVKARAYIAHQKLRSYLQEE